MLYEINSRRNGAERKDGGVRRKEVEEGRKEGGWGNEGRRLSCRGAVKIARV